MLESKPVVMEPVKRYMNVKELAGYLSISEWMVYKYIKIRDIPFIPFGRLVRFDRLEVDRWAARKMVRVGRKEVQ